MIVLEDLPDPRAASLSAPRGSVLAFMTLPRLILGVLFLFALFKGELSDPDYYWHLKTGEYIAQHGALPAGDPFSWTFFGAAWAPHEWLFQLALYGLFTLAGGLGVKVMVAALGTAAVALVHRSAARLLGGSSSALILAVAAYLMLLVWFVPRPHVVTYVLVAWFVDVLLGWRYFAEDRRLWTLAPLMACWTNIHGAFVIGIALVGLFCACEWASAWFGRAEPAARRRLVRLTGWAALTVLATAANPRGFEAWLFPAKLLEEPFAAPPIGEFTSPDFNGIYGRLFLVMVFAFFAVSVYRRHKPALVELAMPLCVLFIGFGAMRHVPIAVLIVVPFLAIALADSPLRALYDRMARSGASLGAKEHVLNIVLLAIVAVALLVATPVEQAKARARLERLLPVGAADFVRSHGITGRLFNEYAQGGYLIWALAPQKVFIDGRGDIYGAFVNEFGTIRSGEAGWEKAFVARDIEVMIVSRTAPIRDLVLGRGDYKLVYDDAHESVVVRRLDRFATLAELPHD